MPAFDIWSVLPLAMFSSLTIGMSKGGLPIVAMLAVPVLAFVMDPLAAAALLLPVYLVSDVYGVWLYRREYSAPNLKLLIPAGCLGVFIGYLAAPHVQESGMNLAIGLTGVFFCLRAWFFTSKDAPPMPVRAAPALFWGTLSGITSFISHAGAPPYQIYILPRKLPKLVFAGTSTILFAIINMGKLPAYLSLDIFPKMDIAGLLILGATALFGAWAGAKLTRIIPERPFFIAVYTALFILSLSLIAKGGGLL
mgnify:FL=1